MTFKNKGFFAITLLIIIVLSACKKNHQGMKLGDINAMLHSQKNYLRSHSNKITVDKTVSMGKHYDSHSDSTKAVIDVINLILEINPDRVTDNIASYKKTTEPMDNGLGLMTTYERKQGELSPIIKMYTRKLKDKDGNYSIWYDFHIEQEEHNPLFNSKENYDLIFKDGKLQIIETFYGEDNLASESAVLKTRLVINEK